MGRLKELDAVKRDLAALDEDARQLIKTLGERGRKQLEGTGMRLWNTTKEFEKRAADGLKDAYETTGKEARRRLEMGRKGIGKHPFGSVGGAVVIGLLLGAVIGFLFGRES